MDKLQQLIDIEEIKNLKHRYFRAIDMADFDLLDNVFSPDISIDYRGGTYRWKSEGKETIKILRRSICNSKSLSCSIRDGTFLLYGSISR